MSRHPVYALVQASVRTQVGRHATTVAIVPRQVFWSDDAIVLEHPQLFSPVDPALSRLAGWADPEVEQATAAPGEKRAARRG